MCFITMLNVGIINNHNIEFVDVYSDTKKYIHLIDAYDS